MGHFSPAPDPAAADKTKTTAGQSGQSGRDLVTLMGTPPGPRIGDSAGRVGARRAGLKPAGDPDRAPVVSRSFRADLVTSVAGSGANRNFATANRAPTEALRSIVTASTAGRPPG
jgi:hypothetical protein